MVPGVGRLGLPGIHRRMLIGCSQNLMIIVRFYVPTYAIDNKRPGDSVSVFQEERTALIIRTKLKELKFFSSDW